MFYLEWLSFYSSFTLLPKRACISRVQKDLLFLEQGIVRVRANSPTQGKIRFFLRCFLRYIEIIPEKNIQFRSLIQNVNFFFFLCLKC